MKGAEKEGTDVRYQLEGAKARITQFGGRERLVQEGIDQILRRSEGLKADIDRVHDQYVEYLQFDLHNYIWALFADLKVSTITNRCGLDGFVHVAVTNNTDGSWPRIETVKGIRSPYASSD